MAKRLSGIVDKPWSFFAIFLFVAIFLGFCSGWEKGTKTSVRLFVNNSFQGSTLPGKIKDFVHDSHDVWFFLYKNYPAVFY